MNREIDKDIDKGIAIYLVVLGHLSGGNPYITFCHMPIFFFVSGYFACCSIQRYASKDIIKRKIKSLLIPYLFWSGISFVTSIGVEYIQGNLVKDMVRRELIDVFLMARSVWFLVILFITLLFFLIVKEISEQIQKSLYVCAVISWILLSAFITFIGGSKFLALYKFAWLFPFFLIGYIVADKQYIFQWSSITSIVLTICYFFMIRFSYMEGNFFAYIQFSYKSLNEIGVGILYYVISLIGVLCIISIAQAISRTGIGMAISDIGKYSVDIYVIHMFMIKAFFFIPTFIEQNQIFYGMYLMVYALLIVLIVYLLSKHILYKFSIYKQIMGANK